MSLDPWLELRLMRALTSGVTTGSTLALVLKALHWAERAQPIAAPYLSDWQVDPFSLVLGIVLGICLYWFLDFWFSVRWALLQWGNAQTAVQRPAIEQPKPLYKIL